ncbi:MAG: chorismate synthase, partial [Novosphingobium sp.]
AWYSGPPAPGRMVWALASPRWGAADKPSPIATPLTALMLIIAAARLRGEDNADPMRPGAGGPEFLANHAGGIAGGISTGQPVKVRVAFKPTSSILTPVETIDRDGAATEIRTKGRHDPCVGIRGVPVVEAMMALVLADQKLLHRGQCGAG